jgi:hypothetical protein
MMTGMDERTAAFREVVDSVSRALADARHEHDASYISLPVLYPSGSMAVVRIEPHQDGRFLITDMGLGFQEADLLGGAKVFGHAASAIAAHAGVKMDRHAFLLTDVRREQLVGAVSIIAACSQEAVQLTAFKLEERKRADAADRLHERLTRLFTPAKVARDAEILGASNTPWHVSTLVTTDGHKAVYEPVSDHHNSIAAALTKFVDLAQLEQSPARIAVVRNKQALGTRLSLIATAANVVEEAVSDQTLERLALVAA